MSRGKVRRRARICSPHQLQRRRQQQESNGTQPRRQGDTRLAYTHLLQPTLRLEMKVNLGCMRKNVFAILSPHFKSRIACAFAPNCCLPVRLLVTLMLPQPSSPDIRVPVEPPFINYSGCVTLSASESATGEPL